MCDISPEMMVSSVKSNVAKKVTFEGNIPTLKDSIKQNHTRVFSEFGPSGLFDMTNSTTASNPKGHTDSQNSLYERVSFQIILSPRSDIVPKQKIKQ